MVIEFVGMTLRQVAAAVNAIVHDEGYRVLRMWSDYGKIKVEFKI